MPTTVDIIDEENATARRARQRRKAADRSRRYRERLRAAREPEARAIDAAISEALAFLLARDGAGVNIGVVGLMRTARLVLEREGYAPAQAAAAIADRLSHRAEHLDPDHVPSLNPGPLERIRPTKAGPWQTPLSSVIEHLRGR
jgi:hypothetical protein